MALSGRSPCRGTGQTTNPVTVTARQTLTGNNDADLSRISARLVETSANRGYRALVLQSNNINFNFEAEIDDAGRRGNLADLGIGSVVQVACICSVHVNENRQPNGFTVLLRS
jgi:hypothetical protein